MNRESFPLTTIDGAVIDSIVFLAAVQPSCYGDKVLVGEQEGGNNVLFRTMGAEMMNSLGPWLYLSIYLFFVRKLLTAKSWALIFWTSVKIFCNILLCTEIFILQDWIKKKRIMLISQVVFITLMINKIYVIFLTARLKK